MTAIENGRDLDHPVGINLKSEAELINGTEGPWRSFYDLSQQWHQHSKISYENVSRTDGQKVPPVKHSVLWCSILTAYQASIAITENSSYKNKS